MVYFGIFKVLFCDVSIFIIIFEILVFFDFIVWFLENYKVFCFNCNDVMKCYIEGVYVDLFKWYGVRVGMCIVWKELSDI